jgi:carboxymethylenebutenolidase
MQKPTNTRIGGGLEAYVVRPAGEGPFPAMLVLMEAYGITGHIKHVCTRFAEAGYLAVAPDIFHGEVIAYSDLPAVMAKIPTVKDDLVMQEIGASLDWLDAQADAKKDAVGIIGFCMGGRLAFLAACRHAERLKAAVCFYGGGIAPDGADRFGRAPPLGEAEKLQSAVFLGYGADDGGITAAEHARIATALSTAKKRYTLAVYPSAGHAFLCEERANYAPEAAELAWRESMGFLTVQLS